MAINEDEEIMQKNRNGTLNYFMAKKELLAKSNPYKVHRILGRYLRSVILLEVKKIPSELL